MQRKHHETPRKKIEAPSNPENENVKDTVQESMSVIAPPHCLVDDVTEIEEGE